MGEVVYSLAFRTYGTGFPHARLKAAGTFGRTTLAIAQHLRRGESPDMRVSSRRMTRSPPPKSGFCNHGWRALATRATPYNARFSHAAPRLPFARNYTVQN